MIESKFKDFEFKNPRVDTSHSDAFYNAMASANGGEMPPAETQSLQADQIAYRPVSQEGVAAPSPQPQAGAMSSTGAVFSSHPVVTQRYGNRNARYNGISGGVNRGTDFAVPTGTAIFAPKGDWEVVESFNGATASGPGNRQSMINRGYGNSTQIRNVKTGELLRFSHLSQAGLKPGQRISGGQMIGLSGATGHVAGKTGQHTDTEYIDSRGRLIDVLNSPYASSFLQ